MTKQITIGLILLVGALLLVHYGVDLFNSLTQPKVFALAMPTPIGIEAGPIKVNISDDTPWISILKLVSTVVGTYAGIKLVNKYVK